MDRPNDGHIGYSEGLLLLFAVLSAMLFLQYPAYLVETGGPAAWMVAIITTVLSLLLFVPISVLAGRFPGLRLAEISAEVVGSWLGGLLSLAVTGWLILSAASTLRNFTETFITAILHSTPPSVIMLTIMLCVVFMAHRGIEAMGRTAQILFPVILAGSLLVLWSAIPQGDPSFLFPLWGYGPGATLWGGVNYGSLTTEILLLIAAFSFRTPKDLVKAGYGSLLLFGASLVVATTVLVMVFGSPEGAHVPLPLFNLARTVHLGRHFQRLEAIVVMFWFFAAATRIAALVYGATIGVSDLLRIPHYRPVVFPLSVIIMSLAFVPKDFMTVYRVERDLIRPLGWGVLMIPLVLWLVALARGKGGRSHAA